MNKTIVVLASGWGATHGGINAFNMDFCHAMRRNIAEYLTCVVVVPGATAEELNDAKNKKIKLVIHGIQQESFLENPPQIAKQIVELLQNEGLSDVDWWFGRDVITGPLATECRKVANVGLTAIFQHMDYEAYQSIKKQNGNIAIKMRDLQKDNLKVADIVFGVGPLLTETAKRYLEKPDIQHVHQIIPGLQNIKEIYLTDNHFQAIIMGRMTQEDDRVKQGRLAAASFAEFSKFVRDNSDQDAWFTVVGFPESEQDYKNEYKELNQIMTKRAERALNVKPISYTKDREALFSELARSHVCMMLSLHEGFGLVGWEAIAAKTPLIVSKQSGLYKLLKNNNLDGYVWPVRIDAPDANEPNNDDVGRVEEQLKNIFNSNNSNSLKERMQKLFSELIKLGYTWDRTAKDCCVVCGIDLLEPFVGLNRISAERTEYFGGRKKEISDLLKILNKSRFVVIYGPSGVGKSSLMDAGLIGAIHNKPELNAVFCYIFVRLSAKPFNSLAKALLKYDSNLQGYEKDSLGEKLKSSPQLLTTLIEDILSRKSQQTELVIAIDQLEELFTIVAQEEDRRIFLNMLAESSQIINTRIVTTIRADYYGMLSQYEKLTPLLNQGSYAVGSISGSKMVEAIAKPLTQAGWGWDEGLPEKISYDAGAELGALPLIAMCLYSLQKKSILRKDTYIKKEDYKGLGSVVNDCARTVEKKLGEAVTKEQLYRLFFHLVRVNDEDAPVRRKIPNAEIINDDSLSELVGILVNERLLVTALIEEIEVVEIAHDSLFYSWEHLKYWIDNNLKSLRDFQKIEITIQNWMENKDEDYLGQMSLGLADNKSMQVLQKYVESRENNTDENITLGFKDYFSGKEDLINLWSIANNNFQKRIRLARAVNDGDLADISKLLNDGVTLQKIDVHTKRVDPVFYAAVTGDDNYEFLSAYINTHPSTGLRRGRTLKKSIFSANNVYRTTRSGTMPLHLAAISGQIKVLRKILALGVNVDTPAASCGRTALSYALARGRSDDVVQLLLNYGAEVSVKGYLGWNIFLAAAFGDKLEFLQHRSWEEDEIHALSQGWSALHLSVQNASIEMISYLLDQGLDPCQKNDSTSNAMMIAAIKWTERDCSETT